MADIPPCTQVTEDGEDTLVLHPAEIRVPTEEFWDLWHKLKSNYGSNVWQQEYINADKDYNEVQSEYLALRGMGTYTDPFSEDDGFVDAVV